MTDQLIELGKSAAALAALAGLAVLAGKAVRGMIRSLRKAGRVIDQVLGDGEQPGLFARLAKLEKSVAGLEAKVGTVVAEVKPNGGASLKDQISRIEQATGATRNDAP